MTDTYSRIKIPFLMDLITIKSYADFQTVNNSGAIDRFGASDISELPFPFSFFFPKSRFLFLPLKSWFLPMRPKNDETYAPCRKYLDERFALSRQMGKYATRAADVLLNEVQVEDVERELVDVSVKAIWQFMVDIGHPEIPPQYIDDVRKQIGQLSEAFNPIAVIKSKRPVANVFNYADETLKEMKVRCDNPDGLVVDVGHTFFAMEMNSPKLLREIAKTPQDDLDDIFIRLGLVSNSVRICTEDGSTLGGLLPENDPATKLKTVVVIDIKSIGQERKDSFFSFAVDGDRQCAAKGAIRQFAIAVQEEIRRRQQ